MPRSRPPVGPLPPNLPAVLLLLLFLVANPAADAAGQVVRGTIIERGTGEPIHGVFVSLLDSTDTRRASTLSDASGGYIVRAPAAGPYRLRAERIGFETALSEPLELAEGETIVRDLDVPSTVVELEGISVSADRVCRTRPEEGGELARLWEEIRKAFSVAEWVEDSGVLRYRVRRFARTLDAEDLTIRDETVRQRIGYSQQPFVAPDPASLAEEGYVQDENGQLVYHGPDARALLSEEFSRTHCFRIVRSAEGEADGLVGLAFTPVPGRDVPDIRGTLWVDEATAELQSLDFRFTGLEGVRRADELGGSLRYRRLPTGAWVVNRWSIRMPMRAATREWWKQPGARENEMLAGIREVGGEVLELSTVGGDLDLAGDRGTIAGVVWDSLTARPLAGARVFLNGTGHSATAGDDGGFSLSGLPEGRYAVAFHHPRMTERGLYIPATEVEVGPGEVRRVRLALPSEAGMAVAACAPVHDTTSAPARHRAILAGRVTDAVTGAGVPGASVRVEWGGESASREREADRQGRFRLCTLPDGARATVRASFLGRSAASPRIRLSAAEPSLQDVSLELTRPTGVVVEVLDQATDEPVEGAEVRLEGVSSTVLTDGRGRASFPGVAPGLRSLEVEHLAYGSVRDSVLVRSAETVRIRVRVASEAIALDPIEVEVEGGYGRGVGLVSAPGTRGTRADVLTRQQIEEVLPRAFDTSDLLRSPELAGLMVTENRTVDGQRVLCIEASRARTGLRGGGCNQVEVYVDDLRLPDPGQFLLNLSPEQVERIEFLSPLEAGAIYGTGSRNGVVLIYTRDGRPR